MNQYLALALIVLGVVIVLGGLFLLARFLVNKYGVAWISKAQSIVACIQSALAGLGGLPANISVYLNDIVQSIIFALATAVSGVTVAQLVTIAMQFIQDIATAAGVPLNDAEIAFITSVLNIVFDFIVSIKYTNKVTSTNYIYIYRIFAWKINASPRDSLNAEKHLTKHVNLTLAQREVSRWEAA